MRILYITFLILLGILTEGCEKYYLSIQQQWIDINYLASSQINTPDPRKNNPPLGQMLIIDWHIPNEILEQNPKVLLDLIFWDYTTLTVELPMEKTLNYTTYQLLNDDYDKKGGILTYKAAIITEDRVVYRESKHQLWVNLITIE